ncbi:aldo/keto reductase [Fibrobacterales bacterium]|nr:aldo/keto reductase [Fibrobacterales bacterium]
MEVSKISMAAGGPLFSEIIQGYWRMSSWNRTPQEHLSFLKQALELGVSTVDHAPVYQSEALFGNVLSLEPSLRSQIEIISKCGIIPGSGKTVDHYDSSGDSIIASVEQSLSNLKTDYLDTLLLHRPDYLMNPDEVAEAFTKLSDEGKVKHFGVSNFSESQFTLLQARLPYSLITNQTEFNPLQFDCVKNGTLDQLQRFRIRPMAWSCLAGGRLFNQESDQIVRVGKVLNELKEELGASSIDAVIYAWVRKHPSRPLVMVGSSQIERLKLAVESISLKMNTEQWYRVLEVSNGHGVA